MNDVRTFGGLARIGAWTLLFVTGVGASLLVESGFQRESNREISYIPRQELPEGGQIELLYIGSSTCRWSNGEQLPDLVDKIKVRLAARADSGAMSFKAVGVALDWRTAAGYEHLKSVGPFDEISVGGNWSNTHVLEHVMPVTGGSVRTPGLIVFRRQIQNIGENPVRGTPVVGDRQLLAVVDGPAAMTRWLERGLPWFEEFEPTGGQVKENNPESRR